MYLFSQERQRLLAIKLHNFDQEKVNGKKITITVPDDLHAKLEEWRSSFNFSIMFQTLISTKVRNKERFFEKMNALPQKMQDIVSGGDINTQKGLYNIGREIGFTYARTSPYPKIKSLEKYIKGWDNRDPVTITAFANEVDNDYVTISKSINFPESNRDYNEIDFLIHIGFYNGVMEFLKQEFLSDEGIDIQDGVIRPNIKAMRSEMIPVIGDILNGRIL